MADFLAAIEGSASSEEMQAAYKAAWEASQGDAIWQKRIIDAKKLRVERAKKETTK